MDLCRQGIELFWPGIRLTVLHDKDYSKDTDLPEDVREVVRRVPYLRKVFDLPYIAPTDQLYCIDSDCMLFDEPHDWPDVAHLSVLPGRDGRVWLEQGSAIWESLGQPPLDLEYIFCGGCWSGKRSEMFEPYRELAIAYVRECVKRGHDDANVVGHAVVCEQCLLNGLWHLAYQDVFLSNYRYPLYRPNPGMALFHLSDVGRTRKGQRMMAAYRDTLARKRAQDGP